MKKSIKVTIAIIMTIVLTVACAAVAVYAATYTSDSDAVAGGAVCRIGAENTGTYYETIAAAVSAAQAKDVITVIADTEITEVITIDKKLTLTSEKEVKIEGKVNNAFTISVSSKDDDSSDVIVSGYLNITNTGTQTFQMIKGDLKITENVKVSGATDVINMGGSSTPGETSVLIAGDAYVTCTGTATKLGAVGAIFMGNNTVTLTIEGGTIETTSDNVHAIRNKSKTSTINISGGMIKAPKATVYCYSTCSGTINFSGGTVKTANGNQCIYLNQDSGYEIDFDMTNGKLTANGDNSLYMNGSGAANVTISGGEITGKDGIIRFGKGTNTLNISGGIITAATQTVHSSVAGTEITISDTANITATSETSYALRVRGGNHTVKIKGGTITAPNHPIEIEGADNTVNITGGEVICEQTSAIGHFEANTTVESSVVNISDNAKIYAGKQAIVAGAGLTFNISGGLIDVSNKYTPDDISGQYAIVTNNGSVNITGGKFILGGTNDSAQMIYQGDTSEGTTTVDGGLFINDNKVNKTIFSAKVDYVSGRILYGKNIDTVISGTAAPKTVKVAYGTAENVYYFYTRFAATDAEKAGTMVDGAQVRLTKGTTGMRFTTTFDEIEGATYGTVIVPASYLANLNSFTLEALEAAGLTCLNIEAINGIDVADGKVTIRAAITNIDPTHYTTAFAAIAYAKVGDTYYYTAFDLADNARTVDYVATEALDDLSKTKEGDYQNKVTAYGATLYSPYTATQREILEGFVSVTLNVPRPTDATLVNCGDGSYMYYVANATADTHTTYAASLVAAGFTQTATNNLEGNIYTTYAKDTQIVTVAYTPNTKELRVIMESAANTSLPSDEEYVAPASPVATTLTQIGQLYDNPATEDVNESTATETKSGDDYITNFTAGMGYVIRLEDGSFIIVDGGYNTKTHAANIYNTLVKQNGSEDNIVIAAWIFTHAHDDHVGAFKAFTEDYANKVTVERFIYNFPAEETTTFADTTGHPNYTAIKNAINKYDGAVTTIAHAGQVFDIANAKVNILFTYELMQPTKELDYYNGCSVVFNVVFEGKTVLFLGDAGGDSANPLNTKDRELTYIKKIYTTNTLKAHIVQAGHHGIDDLGGVFAVEFYDLVDADIMLIPVADRFVKIDDSYVNIYERAAYKQSGDAVKYLAGSTVTVLTLDNGNVSVSTFGNVDAYKNS